MTVSQLMTCFSALPSGMQVVIDKHNGFGDCSGLLTSPIFIGTGSVHSLYTENSATVFADIEPNNFYTDFTPPFSSGIQVVYLGNDGVISDKWQKLN